MPPNGIGNTGPVSKGANAMLSAKIAPRASCVITDCGCIQIFISIEATFRFLCNTIRRPSIIVRLNLITMRVVIRGSVVISR